VFVFVGVCVCVRVGACGCVCVRLCVVIGPVTPSTCLTKNTGRGCYSYKIRVGQNHT
jgi:hypothetical protein